jgi:hypothetical protein
MTDLPQADRLGFYDTLAEHEWKRLGQEGAYARRQQYQTIKASVDALKQQGLVHPKIIEGMELELREIVRRHREILRWRQRTNKRRAMVGTAE